MNYEKGREIYRFPIEPEELFYIYHIYRYTRERVSFLRVTVNNVLLAEEIGRRRFLYRQIASARVGDGKVIYAAGVEILSNFVV